MDGSGAGTPGEDPRSRRLIERLRSCAGPDGFVPFDRFVDLALHDPEVGYYCRPDLRLGRDGDFYTAAHTTPLFGATIAERLVAEFDRLQRPEGFQVVEVGPGDGTLAADLAAALARHPGTDGIDYVGVEPSPSLRDAVAARLAARGPAGPRFRFLPSLAALGPFVGCVVANELLDAFPFRRLVARAGGFHEQGVRAVDGRLVWAEAPMPAAVPPPPLPSELPEGTVVEVSPRAEAFVREVADHLVDGAVLLFDYGAEEPELVRRHPGGTLTAYRGHRSLDDPLRDPGTADLSAFVNFTRIRAAARRAGLTEVACEPQAAALGRWGFGPLRDAALAAAPSEEQRVRVALAAKQLLFGFETFRALELRAGGPPSA